MKMPPILRSCPLFLTGFIVLLAAAFCSLYLNGKAGSFLLLNSWHPNMLNQFFINYTFLGDGMFALMLTALVFIFHKKKELGFALLYAFIISGIVAQVVKRLFPAPRPQLFFHSGLYQHFINGVTLFGNNSLPSGHTATAFALAAVLASMLKGKRLQVFVLTAAALVGYSRIYLGQHFLLDVIVGAIIGWLSGIVSVYLAQKTMTSRFSSSIHSIESNGDISSSSSNSHIPSI